MELVGQKTDFECVEKRHPEPARGPCSYCLKADGTEDAAKTTESSCEAAAGNVWTPRHRCLASKVPMSFASFRANDDEWVDVSKGEDEARDALRRCHLPSHAAAATRHRRQR